MISRSITLGGADNITALEKLFRISEEDKKLFPDSYYPSIYNNNPAFIKTRDRSVTPGDNRKILYLVATKNGMLISVPEIDNCQLPPQAYLGRYEIFPTEFDHRYRRSEPSLEYVCTYWVNIDSIELIEIGEGMIGFKTLLAEDLPAQLVDAVNSPDFKLKYLFS